VVRSPTIWRELFRGLAEYWRPGTLAKPEYADGQLADTYNYGARPARFRD
jgi:hypothetical protein